MEKNYIDSFTEALRESVPLCHCTATVLAGLAEAPIGCPSQSNGFNMGPPETDLMAKHYNY